MPWDTSSDDRTKSKSLETFGSASDLATSFEAKYPLAQQSTSRGPQSAEKELFCTALGRRAAQSTAAAASWRLAICQRARFVMNSRALHHSALAGGIEPLVRATEAERARRQPFNYPVPAHRANKTWRIAVPCGANYAHASRAHQ
jgi:hypothetical protein